MQALIDELKKPEYASMSDQAAADAINAKTVAVRLLVPCSEIIVHATVHGYRATMELAKQDPSNPCRAIAINILSYIDSMKINNVDMDLPATQQMLGGMVQCGFATPEQVASLNALANNTIRWTEHIGLPEIGVGLVRNARKQIGGGAVNG